MTASPPPDRNTSSGYRTEPGPGPRLRTDVVDVYVFRAHKGGGIEHLQLRRARAPLARTWQPIMGHVEPGEQAVQTAVRELHEEVALTIAASPPVLGFWQLEQVHPYFLAEIDAVVCSPRFAVEVDDSWSPALNAEHTDWRWTADHADFLWPGQRHALREIADHLVPRDSPARGALFLPPFRAPGPQ